MESFTSSYLSRAETWLFITTLAYFLMNGAQIFETAVIVPKWTAAPPASFQLFRGEYGLDFKAFWIIFHIIHEITFILAIIFCWKIAPIRNGLILLFILHFSVRVWTVGYFAPAIIEFQRIANTDDLIANLAGRANRWKILNYIRVGVFLAISLGLIPLCLRMLNLRYR